MSRRSLGALALALIISAATGCGNGGTTTRGHRSAPTTTTQIANKKVLVIGDSNVFLSVGAIDRALRDAGFEPTIHGMSGYGVKDADAYWLPKLRELLPENPAVVVVALGTNDTATDAQVQAVAAHIDEIMGAIGDRRVVWITHVDDRPLAIPNGGRIVNGIIRTARERWPNLTILDMAPVLAAHPDLLGDDHLHYNANGVREYARRITKAVESARRAAVR